jgi:ketosteroid isomerase-like protein
MLSWLAHRLISHNMARLNAGDPRPQLRLIGKDSRLVFPGRSSWSGEFVGKEAVTAWLERFARSGLQIFADEVVVKGPPWRMTVCVRGNDHLRAPAGELVYENRYVIWAHGRWGRLTDYEVYEDTEKPLTLDEWLAAQGEPEARAAAQASIT